MTAMVPPPDDPNPVSSGLEKLVSSDAGGEPTPLKEEADLALQGKKEKADVIRQGLENLDYAKDIEARDKYARRLFLLVVGWILAVFAIVLLQGFLGHVDKQIFYLSDGVVIAFISGTTANVLGLLAIVVRYLFYRK